MGDQTIADNIVTAKAGTVVAENLKLALSTAGGGSITPNTIKAMSGISQNAALQIAPDVQTAMNKLDYRNISNVALWNSANVALANLTTMQSNLGFGGATVGNTSVPGSPNQAAFGSFLNQAKGHIDDSIELKKSTNFMSNIDFNDLGSGITNMSSLSTQGLNTSFGDLSGAANALTASGPCFDLTNMSNFGQGSGLVEKLSSVKLANASGVNAALTENGVNLNDLNNPVYADTITNTLSDITDPTTIATVTDQFGISPYGKISSLNDFTDLNKLTNPATVSGLTGGLTGMSTKFSDLGASFPSPTAAADMLNGIEVPNIPTLDSSVTSLNKLISDESSTLTNLTGTGTGALGMPSTTDFLQSVAGGPGITAFNSGTLTESSINTIGAIPNQASTLFDKAGVDFTTPAPNKLSGAMTFATNLHKFGADSEISSLLSNMAVGGNAYGDSIKASLAEGKNKALMAANGIKPLNFQG
jgi:hypothetical protein